MVILLLWKQSRLLIFTIRFVLLQNKQQCQANFKQFEFNALLEHKTSKMRILLSLTTFRLQVKVGVEFQHYVFNSNVMIKLF